LKRRKILITGGAGSIGASLAHRLVTDQDNMVVVIDNLLTGLKRNIPTVENCKFIRADCNCFEDLASVMTSISFDYVFHYAAVVGVERTLQNPMKVLQDARGIENIVSLSRSTGVSRIFYASSSEVYGESTSFPQRELTTPLNSKLPYSVIKNLGEAYLRSAFQDYDLPYTIFRFFNTYGPLQSKDFVLPRFLSRALTGEPLTIFGDGLQTRTFCYIDDNLDVVQKILYENVFVNEVLNIGSDVECTIIDLAKTIIETTNSSSKIIHLPALAEGDMNRRLPDISKMRSVLGRDPILLREGLKRMLSLRSTT